MGERFVTRGFVGRREDPGAGPTGADDRRRRTPPGVPGECAHCHTVSVVGTMRVYMRGPGVVIRCPACADVVLRIVRTPRGLFVDTSGAIGMHVDRA